MKLLLSFSVSTCYLTLTDSLFNGEAAFFLGNRKQNFLILFSLALCSINYLSLHLNVHI
jgi:hypothetical protein